MEQKTVCEKCGKEQWINDSIPFEQLCMFCGNAIVKIVTFEELDNLRELERCKRELNRHNYWARLL